MTPLGGAVPMERGWMASLDGPVAELRLSPWRLIPNAAFAELEVPRQHAAFLQAFASAGSDLLARLAEGRAFAARLLLEPAEPIEGTASRLLHADFKPLGEQGDWLCALVELTDLHQDRQREEASAQHLTQMLDLLNTSMALFDRCQTVLYGNREYARAHKLEPAELPGMTVAQVLKGNDAVTRPYREELLRTGRPVRYERVLRDYDVNTQHVVEVQLWPIKDSQGDIDKVAVLTKEVTRRHQGMEALRQTLERLDRLFEAGIEGIVLLEDCVVTDANPIACRQFGIARERLIGQPMPQLLRALELMPTSDNDMSLPLLSRLSGGANEPPLEIVGIELHGDATPTQALLLRDLSYRQEAQQRISRLVADLRAQRDRAEVADRGKSVFLASASHDLRQPIHALGLFLSSLQSLSVAASPPDTGTLLSIVDRMRTSLDGLMGLLDMLLGVSVRDAEQRKVSPRALPLQPLFDDLIAEFAGMAADKGLHLRAMPSRLWAFTDPMVLRRILANYLANAVRYTHRGGIVLGARARGDRVGLEVWDTGVGIAPEQLDAIFQEFYRVQASPATDTRPDGQGLGLAIARESAALLGSRLEVRSVPDRGSVFSVRVPRCESQRLPELVKPIGEVLPIVVGKHILLIDDDEQVLVATTRLLESWGHSVRGVASASEAMRLYEEEPQRIDAMICDYMLGPSMDGLELLLRLRARHPRPLPVCMVTGDVSSDRLEQSRLHGFTLLHKPVSARELQRFLQLIA